MSSYANKLAENEAVETLDDSAGPRIPLRDYIAFINTALKSRDISTRQLALKTGIRRDRLSNILKMKSVASNHHRSMTLVELQMILHALGIEFMQAVLRVEAVRDLEQMLDGRYSSLFAMAGAICKDLAPQLIEALDDVEGMDGTEIRPEWAQPINTGVVEKVVREVAATIARRASLRSMDDLGR